MTRVFRIILYLVSLATPAALQAQKIEYVNSTLWSGLHDAKVVGNYAYCAFPNGLAMLNVSNPTSPSFVSR
jgi:hypothetical protein